MQLSPREEIIHQTIPILAREGYAGTSMRMVAAAIAKEPSSIYVHFENKEALLRAVRMSITTKLDSEQRYISDADARTMLRETIQFQIKNREYIVALLQYFMSMRQDFPLADGGYVPDRAYQHMARIIEAGIEEGVYRSCDIAFDAKTSTHLINGFLMEYFDRRMSEQQRHRLVEQLAGFLERSFGFLEDV